MSDNKENTIKNEQATGLRNREPEVWDAVIRNDRPRRVRRLLVRGLSLEDAEDITQDTHMKAWRGIGGWGQNGVANFEAWTDSIGYHCRVDHSRAALRARRVEPLEKHEIHPNLQIQSNTQFDQDEMRTSVQMAVTQLPVHYRTIIVEYYFHEKSLDDIARENGMSVNTAKSRLQRARSMLARDPRLQEYGF